MIRKHQMILKKIINNHLQRIIINSIKLSNKKKWKIMKNQTLKNRNVLMENGEMLIKMNNK